MCDWILTSEIVPSAGRLNGPPSASTDSTEVVFCLFGEILNMQDELGVFLQREVRSVFQEQNSVYKRVVSEQLPCSGVRGNQSPVLVMNRLNKLMIAERGRLGPTQKVSQLVGNGSFRPLQGLYHTPEQIVMRNRVLTENMKPFAKIYGK